MTGENKKSKLEGFLFHDLRRSAVRNMVRRGVSETVATRLPVHMTRSIFLRYDITQLGDIEDATAKIERGSKIPESRTDTPTSTHAYGDATLEVA